MGTDDLTGDGQAEACPFFVLTAGKVGFVETVKDIRDAIFRDADSAVFDGYEYLVVFLRSFYFDHRVLVAEFYGIVDQVIEYLLDACEVGGNVQFVAG